MVIFGDSFLLNQNRNKQIKININKLYKTKRQPIIIATIIMMQIEFLFILVRIQCLRGHFPKVFFFFLQITWIYYFLNQELWNISLLKTLKILFSIKLVGYLYIPIQCYFNLFIFSFFFCVKLLKILLRTYFFLLDAKRCIFIHISSINLLILIFIFILVYEFFITNSIICFVFRTKKKLYLYHLHWRNKFVNLFPPIRSSFMIWIVKQ